MQNGRPVNMVNRILSRASYLDVGAVHLTQQDLIWVQLEISNPIKFVAKVYFFLAGGF